MSICKVNGLGCCECQPACGSRYENFNIGKIAKTQDIQGKLILFKDNKQAYIMYAEIKQDSEYIYTKSGLVEYLDMIKDGNFQNHDIYSGGNEKLYTIRNCVPTIYPFVFIPFNLLEIHKITGFVRLHHNITINASNYGDNLQDIKFVPVSKNGILCEMSNEV